MDELKHNLIPKHNKLSESEKTELFDKYKITLRDLPKISLIDPAIAHLEPAAGDVISINRVSATAGDTVFYRGVINE